MAASASRHWSLNLRMETLYGSLSIGFLDLVRGHTVVESNVSLLVLAAGPRI